MQIAVERIEVDGLKQHLGAGKVFLPVQLKRLSKFVGLSLHENSVAISVAALDSTHSRKTKHAADCFQDMDTLDVPDACVVIVPVETSVAVAVKSTVNTPVRDASVRTVKITESEFAI